MAGSFSLALVGFPESESATFESFFRLAARRPPAYVVQDEVLDAQVLVVNADNAQAVHLVRHAQLQGRVLLIGHGDAGTGWPLQRKPVKLVGVLAALDELVGARPRAAATFAPPVGPRRGADPGFAATEPLNGATLPPAPPARAPRVRGPQVPDTRVQDTRAPEAMVRAAMALAMTAPDAARRPAATVAVRPRAASRTNAATRGTRAAGAVLFDHEPHEPHERTFLLASQRV